MSAIFMGALSVLKKIVVKVLSEKFFEWLFFWAADALVKKTTTKLDDEFIKKAREIYEQSK